MKIDNVIFIPKFISYYSYNLFYFALYFPINFFNFTVVSICKKIFSFSLSALTQAFTFLTIPSLIHLPKPVALGCKVHKIVFSILFKSGVYLETISFRRISNSLKDRFSKIFKSRANTIESIYGMYCKKCTYQKKENGDLYILDFVCLSGF